MTVQTLLLFLLGGGLLIGGAELLVKGASRLAIAAGVSPLVIGLTVVAFGTSSPEFAVTVGATLTGRPDLAVGNVVGSNIANVLLILGIAALIAPLVVSQQLVRLDVPLVIIASIVVWVMALDGRIGRIEGLILFSGIVAYTAYLVWRSRRKVAIQQAKPEHAEAAEKRRRTPWLPNVGLVVIGLVLLLVGSRWLLNGAVDLAAALGVSQLVIGLTVIAVGTSLPEVATSVLASIRGERDIAVGNVVGSNMFNLLMVLGLGSAIAPAGVPVAPGALTFDIPVMTAVALACLPVFFTRYAIARWEGLIFLGYYAAYLTYLVLHATEHDVLPAFRAAILWFALPLTAVTLLVLAGRYLTRILRVGRRWRERREMRQTDADERSHW